MTMLDTPIGPEWMTANSAVAYPFTKKVNNPGGPGAVALGGHDGGYVPVSELFVDAAIYSTYDAIDDGDILYVNMFNFIRYADSYPPVAPGTSDLGTIIVNQYNEVIFDSGGAEPNSVVVLGDYVLIEWIAGQITGSSSSAGSDSTGEIIVRYLIQKEKLVLNTGFVLANAFHMPCYPTDAEFTARVVERAPAAVRSIGVNGVWYDGDIEIAEGYNVDLTTTGPSIVGTRRKNTITITGSAGSGLGRYADCDPSSQAIRSINSIRPDDKGNITLQGDGCYWFAPPMIGDIPVSVSGSSSATSSYVPGYMAITKSALIIYNDCSACCECVDYVEAYELVKYVLGRAHSVKDYVTNVKDMYDLGVTRWVAALAARSGESTLTQIQCIPGGIINVTTYLINNTDADVVANPTVNGYYAWTGSSTGAGSASLVAGSAWRYTDETLWERVDIRAGTDPPDGAGDDELGWGAAAATDIRMYETSAAPVPDKFSIKPARVMIYMFQLLWTGGASGDTIEVEFDGDFGGTFWGNPSSEDECDLL